MAALPGEELRKIKVLLVEDHAVVREGTAELINRQTDMMVVGEAGDGLAAVDEDAADAGVAAEPIVRAGDGDAVPRIQPSS